MLDDMKRGGRAPAQPGEATRLGEELREAREARGLTLEDMSATLRIRRVYLAALEEGRVRDLPAPAYAVGFVRSYARALGLDDDAMARRFREGGGPVGARKTDLIFPEPVPDRGVPAGALVLLGLVIAAGAYVGWYRWSGAGDRTVDAVAPPPRLEASGPVVSEAPGGIAAIPPAGAPRPGPAGAVPAASPPPQGAPGVTAPRPGPPPPAAVSGPTVAGSPSPPLQGATPAAVPAPTPVAPAAVLPAPAAGEGRITLRARGEAWVQVRERSGPILLNRVLRAGESWAVPARDGLLLTTGNVGSLDVVVDGQVANWLGPAQAVRRDVPLEAERLKAGIPAPPPAPPRPPAAPAAAPPPAG